MNINSGPKISISLERKNEGHITLCHIIGCNVNMQIYNMLTNGHWTQQMCKYDT